MRHAREAGGVRAVAAAGGGGGCGVASRLLEIDELGRTLEARVELSLGLVEGGLELCGCVLRVVQLAQQSVVSGTRLSGARLLGRRRGRLPIVRGLQLGLELIDLRTQGLGLVRGARRHGLHLRLQLRLLAQDLLRLHLHALEALLKRRVVVARALQIGDQPRVLRHADGAERARGGGAHDGRARAQRWR